MTFLVIAVCFRPDPRLENVKALGVVACRPGGLKFDYRIIVQIQDQLVPSMKLLGTELDAYKDRLATEHADYRYSRFLALAARREGLVHFGSIESQVGFDIDDAMNFAFVRIVALNLPPLLSAIPAAPISPIRPVGGRVP